MTLRSPTSAGLAVTLVLVGTTASFAATTRSVCPSGCQFSTIQSAVNAAVAGDTIAIGKGHYFENVVIVGKRITLQGIDRRTTIIDGNGKGTVVTIGDPDTAARTLVSISDVTITRGFAHVTDPLTARRSGGGIDVAVGASLTLHHSIIVANHSDSQGGGINASLADAAALSIRDVVFSNNDAGTSGGGLCASGENDTVDISDTTFVKNTAGSEGGGLCLGFSRSQLSLSAVSFLNNKAARGGGASLSTEFSDQPFSIQGLVATNNSATQDGGGLLLAGGANLRHAVVAQNTAATNGGGILFLPAQFHPGVMSLTDSYVVQNQAASGGGMFIDTSNVTLHNTVVENNQPDNCVATLGIGGGACP